MSIATEVVHAEKSSLRWAVSDVLTIARRNLLAIIRIPTALVFSILFIIYSRNTGDDKTLFEIWSPFIMAGVAFVVGIPVYFAQRKHMTQPEPVPSFTA